jgi:hypothetical protein
LAIKGITRDLQIVVSGWLICLGLLKVAGMMEVTGQEIELLK